MPDADGPSLMWRGEGETPVAVSLSEVLRGREIIHAEHETDSRWHGLLRLRLRGAKAPQLLIRPVEREAGVDTPVQWALAFSLGRTPTLWTPRRSRLGDGPLAVRDLQRLVGKVIGSFETGALTQDGLAVAKVDFTDGTRALVFPHPLPFALALAVCCCVTIRVVFLDPIRRDDRVPSTPGEALLD